MYCFPKKFANGFCAGSRNLSGADCAECKKAPESFLGFPARQKSKKTGEIQAKCRLYSPSGAAFRMRRMRAFWSAYMW